jgi:hypothetical protein
MENLMAFKSEKELVQAAKKNLSIKTKPNTEPIFIGEEVKGLFGIPDLVIAYDNKGKLLTFAYEMKLSKWERALMQAFRYKAFADMSYVVMDSDHITSALSNRKQFVNSNVGLISIDGSGNMYFHHHPYVDEPFSPQLERKFSDIVTNDAASNGFAT